MTRLRNRVPGTGWRVAPSVVFASLGAFALLVAGVALSRPDAIAVSMPLALWAVAAVGRRTPADVVAEVRAADGWEQGWLLDDVRARSAADMVEVSLIQGERTRAKAFVPGTGRIRTRSRVLHSGPLRTVEVAARAVDSDGGMLAPPIEAVSTVRTVQPPRRALARLPLAPRLTGLHGAHEGARPGQGGDFRDIHPFAPGDELRRVDWKATARAARRPGDLLVRRTNTLSDASVVIAMDTADELGAVVATWGTGDLERSGVTSLDHARSAARSIAAAAVAHSDRVAFHTLAHGGRSVRSGGGSRHLARVIADISASGREGDDARFRRTPPVPQGSMIYVLSTFFDGAAAEIALKWRAAGHRVVAVDTLPALDVGKLSREREFALRVLLAERDDMLHGLRTSGVETLRWARDPAAELAALSRTPPANVGSVRRQAAGAAR
ncbi:DUF58 domain-containing protein [Microbacterium sp. NPDC058345]|uniref:DUF58 domain-containing protein n=1 Tax=Microbacterium sp. NPDC058345 TaxID=3346455 RepID=UPI003655D84F